MKNFGMFWSAKSDNHKRVIFAYFFAALGFLGFLDATYLTVAHYSGMSVTCSLIKGCDAVLSSRYATIGKIPVALVGTIYYLLIFFSALVFISWKKKNALLFAAYLSFAGFAASLGFLFLQVFIIKAFCEYCLLSAAISTALCTVGMGTIHSYKS